MQPETGLVLGTIGVSLLLFITNVIRYDIVALGALLFLVATGVVKPEDAFLGFANPAVITIIAVLVIGQALDQSGIAVPALRLIGIFGRGSFVQVLALTVATAVMSAFINNVGALALLMPAAIDLAREQKKSPGMFLMPMAFASLLGGMTTVIGTPPNLIISDFRRKAVGEGFAMFDFSFTGGPVALAGVAFLALVGWRLIPKRKSELDHEPFEIKDYFAEVTVPGGSSIIGKSVPEVVNGMDDVAVTCIHRGGRRLSLSQLGQFEEGDVLALKSTPDALQRFVDNCGVELRDYQAAATPEEKGERQETELVEALVMQHSMVDGRSAARLGLRSMLGVMLLAVSRKEELIRERLKTLRLRVGDILLLQIPPEDKNYTLSRLGLLPLEKRDIRIRSKGKLQVALLIFVTGVSLSALGITTSAVAFVAAAAAMVVFRIITTEQAYESVDWGVVVLVGAMIPVGMAFETTGAAALLTKQLTSMPTLNDPVILLTVLMIFTMVLSDFLNNVATAIIMAPIAVAIAEEGGYSGDAFLMSIAIAASCAFLTPIGHQSNALVMGPGGYKFRDYFFPGVLLEVIVLVVSVPLLLYWWPLKP